MWQAYELLSSRSFSPFYDDLIQSRPYPVTAPAATSLLHASNFTAAMRSYYAGAHATFIPLLPHQPPPLPLSRHAF